MPPSKILLANYPKINQTATFVQIDGSEERNIFTGYDIAVDSREVTLTIARDIITAILTYDEVYLLGSNVTDVMQVLGSEGVKELLRHHLMKVVPDVDMNPVLTKVQGGEWQQDFFGYANGGENLDTGERIHFDGPFGHVENWLYRKNLSTAERNALIYLMEENAAQIDLRALRPDVVEETHRDMRSLEFVLDKDFYRLNGGKLEFNMISNLRLHHLNTLSIIAAKLGMDGLKTDGAIAQLMLKKTRSVLSQPIPDGVEALTCINQQKGFPDLGQLFVDGTIGLDDVLKMRASLQGRLFRYWAKADAYEEAQMRQDVMNSVHSVLGGRVGSVIRMLACTLVGIGGVLPGLIASATDSLIVNEIVRGWHPNMFLDNKLKKLIDAKIDQQAKARLQAEAALRFKGVGRNDPCPCGSGKKFKNCHGKG